MSGNSPDPRRLLEITLSHLPYRPELEQKELLAFMTTFICSSEPRKAFIINGFAGTGKTSLMAALVKAFADLKRKFTVLAPTGRAAKVASGFAGVPAYTIHKKIYRPVSADPGNESFILAPNRTPDTIFIVDEASMISDSRDSRSLLLHLVRHIYSAPGCSMILVGDVAQLPPVGHCDSPAMSPNRLRELGLYPAEFTLSKPMRQASGSGILYNATLVRNVMFTRFDPTRFGLVASRFKDVEIVSSSELADYLSTSWGKVGIEETIIITRSNKRANNFNRQIRARVLEAEEPIQQGERLIVSKNDYYWCEKNKVKGFIANGEIAEVKWVGSPQKAFGRYFVDTELRLPDIDKPIGARIMLRSLMVDGPTIVADSFPGEFSEKVKSALDDPNYNALQVKYAYCITCHKAQGGQWKHVYIDLGAIPRDAISADFYRWLYTAITRATEKLYLVNPSFPVV